MYIVQRVPQEPLKIKKIISQHAQHSVILSETDPNHDITVKNHSTFWICRNVCGLRYWKNNIGLSSIINFKCIFNHIQSYMSNTNQNKENMKYSFNTLWVLISKLPYISRIFPQMLSYRLFFCAELFLTVPEEHPVVSIKQKRSFRKIEIGLNLGQV